MSRTESRNGEATAAVRHLQLVNDISKRVPQPLDAFEIAAVIESTGITDSVAAEDYGAADVFELADRVFPAVFDANASQIRITHEPEDSGLQSREIERSIALESTGRGLLALAPLAVLIFAIEGLGAAGWSTAAVLALSFGGTGAMLFTSGPILAIGRRTSIYLGFDYRGPARRFVAFASLGTLLACIVVAAVAFGVLGAFGLLDKAQRELFAATFVAWSLLWLLAASLTLTGASRAAAASMATGLLAGGSVAVATGSSPGLVVGYVVTIVALLFAWSRAYRSGRSLPFGFPARSLFFLEAAPYAAFGSAFALLLFEPHFLGWGGHTFGTRGHALSTLELSFTLALPPALLASGIYERVMRSFWLFAKDRRHGDDARAFQEAVATFRLSELSRYALVLAGLSAITATAVEVAMRLGALTTASQFVFVSAVSGFFLLGIGQFNCLFMLNLSRPRPALISAFSSVLAMSVIGIPLASIDFRLSGVTFVIGSLVLLLMSELYCTRMMANVDYYYASAF